MIVKRDVAVALADLSLDENFASTTVDLSLVFTDADAGDILSLSVVSGDEGVATVSVDGTTITINEAGLGTTTVIVTAPDLALASVNDTFDITINNVNDAPVVAAALADLSP